MKLTKVRVTEFQSIQDSTEFDIGDITGLVGKNEAGKTALLKALYRLHPLNETDGSFNATHDYPRRSLIAYEGQVSSGSRNPATVAQATYALEPDDIATIQSAFGSECFKNDAPTVTLSKGYSNQLEVDDIEVDSEKALAHFQSNTEQAAEVQGLTVEQLTGRRLPSYIFDTFLKERIPKFLYFDEYFQLKGRDNLEALMRRVKHGTLENPDLPLLGLIGLAGLKLEQLVEARETETLIARIEAAGNELTQSVLTYWSQNRHLRMKFDIRQAQPEDGEGLDTGTNILARVEDTKHMVTTALQTRSRGFIWFFSFLAWYSNLRNEGANLILLLDEPGLSLHAKAQADLLRYFEEDLIPHHQLIYTTHSPFMVDPGHFDRVRIVQDLSVETDSVDLPEEQQGTKVITEVLEATPDSLFPLQGALGYEIYQTLFVGPNCLVVEGASDLLYIQTISAFLQGKGRAGLSADWTITPVGGAGNVPTFVALIGARTNLNVTVLIDLERKAQQSVVNLYKSKLLEKRQVMTFADFTGGNEADIEDMFAPEFYVKLVNQTFDSSIPTTDLVKGQPRIVPRLEEYLKGNPLPNNTNFNHYRPARCLTENIGSLGAELDDETLDRFQRAFDALNKLL